MATPAKKITNGDGISAAVEASRAVQTLNDTGMDIEKLIDQVSRLNVGDDPLVVENRAKLKEFQAKKDTLATDIASMEQKSAQLRRTLRERCSPAPLQTSSD
jgi:prefoldin subunit 5